MIIVNVKFTSIEVSKYTRSELVLKINFDDGIKERTLEKKSNLESAEELTDEVFTEVRRLEKELNDQKTGDFLEDVVIVRIEDDEKISEKMQNAFRRIKEDMRKLKTGAITDNYLQDITMFQRTKINL